MTGSSEATRVRAGKLTPMLAQYLRVKEQVGDAVLLFRLGDFYEMFFEDAERVAPMLDLTLTSRNKDDPNPIPMCGVPHHAAPSYISRMVGQGLRVAICDQVREAGGAPGLIERALVRVITPGTVLDEDEGLGTAEPGYLVAIEHGGTDCAVAIATLEVSTGEVRLCRAASAESAIEELRRIGAREVVYPHGDERLETVARAAETALTARRPVAALPDSAERALARVDSSALGGDGGEALFAALRSALAYAADTVRAGLEHLRAPVVYGLGDHLMLDERTRRNLNVLEGPSGSRHGSLWWAIDRSATPMGSRCIREWLTYPILDLSALGERLDAIEALLEAPGCRADLSSASRPVGDLERLVARIGIGRAGPRELVRLASALLQAVEVERLVRSSAGVATLLTQLADDLTPPAGLGEDLRATLADSPPLQTSEGGAIRDGADAEVDRLRSLSRDAQSTLAALEARERQATGIGSLKVRYHRVLGYFFEVTRANARLVPDRYVRRQSVANAERFTTAELIDIEKQLTTAEQRCREREAALVAELFARVAGHQTRLTRLAHAFAVIDALVGLAETAHRRGYVRPKLHRGRHLAIRDGRHPVVEQTSAAGAFVANDTILSDGDAQVILLTGPNMAGKSTYLRQVALIVLLAHTGSFVPAGEAELPLTDRIWTRVGAADDLVAGDSTFMMEMKETAAILNDLSPRSLVVLDEIGRGTSTYDGIAIAWAVAEHLHDLEPAPGCRVKTLFATHFHELTALAETHPRLRNYSVAVREWGDDVLFLRRVVPGPASRSYGVAVARLAGVPASVVERARELLALLECGTSAGGPIRAVEPSAEAPGARAQLELFGDAAAALRRELAQIDVHSITPIEALQRLSELSERARRG